MYPFPLSNNSLKTVTCSRAGDISTSWFFFFFLSMSIAYTMGMFNYWRKFRKFEFAYYAVAVWHCTSTASITKVNVKLWHFDDFIRRKIIVYLQLSAEGIKTWKILEDSECFENLTKFIPWSHLLETRNIRTLQLSTHRVDDCRSIQPTLLSYLTIESCSSDKNIVLLGMVLIAWLGHFLHSSLNFH